MQFYVIQARAKVIAINYVWKKVIVINYFRDQCLLNCNLLQIKWLAYEWL